MAVQAVHLRRQAAVFFHAGNRQQAASTGKRGTPRAPRTAGVAALKRLFDELGARYKDRPGGYTRIIKLGRRDGDNAELAIIELVDSPREIAAAESSSKTTEQKRSARGTQADGTTESARRGGRKADKTFEKDETTRARGRGIFGSKKAAKDDDKAGSGGRRAKKTESTANEKDTDK